MLVCLAQSDISFRHTVEHQQPILDPVERISEVLFGLIMVLTVTSSLSIVSRGPEAIHEVVYGAVGCNLAWGIIDAYMYLMARLGERAQDNHIVRAVRSLSSHQASDAISMALPRAIAQVLSRPELDAIRDRVQQFPAPHRPRLNKRDWVGAAAVFLLVVLATLPVVLPFLIIGSTRMTIRVSNGIALGMLFLCGYAFGRYLGDSPWHMGLKMTAIGMALVGIAIFLGG